MPWIVPGKCRYDGLAHTGIIRSLPQRGDTSLAVVATDALQIPLHVQPGVTFVSSGGRGVVRAFHGCGRGWRSVCYSSSQNREPRKGVSQLLLTVEWSVWANQ